MVCGALKLSECDFSDPFSHEDTLLNFPHCSLTDFDAATVAIIAVKAIAPLGTLKILALDGPFHAGTALGAAPGDPGLACLQKPQEEKGSENLAVCSRDKFTA